MKSGLRVPNEHRHALFASGDSEEIFSSSWAISLPRAFRLNRLMQLLLRQ